MRHDTDILKLYNALVFDPNEGLTPEHIERAKRTIAGRPFKIILAVLDFRPRIKSWRDLFTSPKKLPLCLPEIDLHGKGFHGYSFYGAYMQGANLDKVRVYYRQTSEMMGGSVEKKYTTYASIFPFTDLTGATCTSANFNSSSFLGAELVRVDFSGSLLRDVDLRDANCAGARFEGTDLRGARFNEKTNFFGMTYNHRTQLSPELANKLGVRIYRSDEAWEITRNKKGSGLSFSDLNGAIKMPPGLVGTFGEITVTFGGCLRESPDAGTNPLSAHPLPQDLIRRKALGALPQGHRPRGPQDRLHNPRGVQDVTGGNTR